MMTWEPLGNMRKYDMEEKERNQKLFKKDTWKMPPLSQKNNNN